MKHEHWEYLLPKRFCEGCPAHETRDAGWCLWLRDSMYCLEDMAAFPVVAHVCGLPVREVPRHAFDGLVVSPIPLQREVERGAWERLYSNAVEWVGANWGCSELEVTPHLSKIAAGYLTRHESMGYEGMPEFAHDLWEVWHIIDDTAKEV